MEGRSLSGIAAAHSLGRSALQRHKAHVAVLIAKARAGEAAEATLGAALGELIDDHLSRAGALLELAEEAARQGMKLDPDKYLREYRLALELRGRFTGELPGSDAEARERAGLYEGRRRFLDLLKEIEEFAHHG